MLPSILLLDCSSLLSEKLRRQGFDVASGRIGYCTGIRQLPSQIYEKEILVYNPGSFPKYEGGDYYIATITDHTPEYSLTHLKDHILRGATFLIFVNRIADNIKKQNEAYQWIPFMPEISFTKDHQPMAVNISESYYQYLVPIVLQSELEIPVLQKIEPLEKAQAHPPDVLWLFYNKNHNSLGVFIKRGRGQLIILPKYKSNEEIIGIFLHRVIPKLYKLQTRIGLIDKFSSPEESTAGAKIQEIEDMQRQLNNAFEEAKEQLGTAQRNKVNTIKNDETAQLILNYYDLATQQENVALFYLYKIIEAVEKKCGGEREAKNQLNCNAEWNLIGKLANASYADIRHAPKPGEKIKEWTQEEIKECFEAAQKIILTYFGTLFQAPH